MNRLYSLPTLLVALMFALVLIGCSGGSNPVTPSDDAGQYTTDQPPLTPVDIQPAGPAQPADAGEVEEKDGESVQLRDDRFYFGVWDVSIDPDTLEATVLPNRMAEMHVNVTTMITPPQCYDCLGIQVLNVDPVTNIISVNVSLRNPTQQITGYDVRATLLFPLGDNREMVNRDGFTKIFAGDVRSPFKAFAKDQPSRAFFPGAVHYEQMDILFPPPMNLSVTYVVDASYPTNQEEPYQFENVYLDGGVNECNSAEGWLYADVSDWQGNETGITLDLTPLGGEVVEMEHVINHTFRYYLNNELGAEAGTYRLWMTASSEDTDFDLYDFYELEVTTCDNWPPQWDDTTGIVELNSVSGGLEVVYGTASDDDAPVTYNVYYSQDEPIEWTTATFENDADGSPYVLEGLTDESEYWVGVRAMDVLSNEEKNTVQMSGIPSQPPDWISTVGIVACNPLDKAVEVIYGEAVDPQTPVTYNIYYSENETIDFDTDPFISDTESPTIVPDLNNFQEYQFAVRAMDALGSEDQNTNQLPCTPNGPPEWVGDPGILSTEPIDGCVIVTYGEAIDVDLPITYRIYYSETSPIDFATAPYEEDTDGSPHTVCGLTNGQTYFFAVRAVDSTGVEDDNTVTLPGTPNSAPTWLNDEVGVLQLIPFDHEVTVHYGHAIDTDVPITYYIYYSETSPIDYENDPYETTTDESPYVVDGLTNNQVYFFSVRAEDGLGIMETNTVELSTIPNPAPVWDTTIGVTDIQPGDQMLTVFYGTAHDIDMPVTYRVYYSETTPIDFDTAPYVDDPDGSPTVLFPLENGKTYFVAVRAVDSWGHEDQNTNEMSGVPMGTPDEVWSVPTGGVVQGSPALVDLDSDLILDVVIGDQANKMAAYSGFDGSVIWSFPTGGWVDSSPAVANMGGDLTEDVVFGSLDKNVYCVDGATGGELWSTTVVGGIVSSPTLVNIKNAWQPEVIIGALSGNVYCLDGEDGSILWTFPTGAGIFSSPGQADLNGDSVADFVVGSRDGNVYAINGATGFELWSFPINEWVNSSPALFDLNEDTVADVVIAGLDGDVYAINGSTGTEIWSFPTGAYIWTSPAIGLIDGDMTPDVVLGTDNSNVYAISGASGTEIWSFPSMDRIWSSAALVDVTEDSIPDAIVGSDDGYLYGIDGEDGALLFAHATSDWVDSSPAVADIDGDSNVEIAFGGFDGYVYLVTVDWATAGIAPWPMFRHDLLHTGMY